MTLAELKELVESVVLPMKDQIPGAESLRSVVVVARPTLRAVAVFFDGAVSAHDPAAVAEATIDGASCFTSNFAVNLHEAQSYRLGARAMVCARARGALLEMELLLEDNRRKNAAVAVG